MNVDAGLAGEGIIGTAENPLNGDGPDLIPTTATLILLCRIIPRRDTAMNIEIVKGFNNRVAEVKFKFERDIW